MGYDTETGISLKRIHILKQVKVITLQFVCDNLSKLKAAAPCNERAQSWPHIFTHTYLLLNYNVLISIQYHIVDLIFYKFAIINTTTTIVYNIHNSITPSKKRQTIYDASRDLLQFEGYVRYLIHTYAIPLNDYISIKFPMVLIYLP